MLKRSRFGELLVQKEVIDNTLLDKVLHIQSEEGTSNPTRMADIIVSDFNINHHAVFSNLASFYAFREIEMDVSKLNEKQIKQITNLFDSFPEEFKNQLLFKRVLPYQIQKGRTTLIVLAADPTERIVERIPVNSEYKKYEVAYCKLSSLNELLELIAPKSNEFLDILREAGEQIEDVAEKSKKAIVDDYALDDEINKSLLVSLFEACLIEAVRKGASDIHIVPHEADSVDFLFRTDGKLHSWRRQERTSPEAVSAVVKDRSFGVDRFERGTAQDGFIQRMVDGHLIRYRISIVPITSSEYERSFESIVIRIIDDRNVITDLRKLGFQEKAEKDFVKAISKSKGIVLLTGPTGSGKSTTLMAALCHTINPTINVLTCEDPVEYHIRGARQIKIDNYKLTFEGAIRSILRHDPDVVMVGEIRDKITADTAIKLANTGHLTFSTLHTNDAPSAISRLFKMGVETFLLAYAINIIVAQRLVRMLCKECRIPLTKAKYQAALDIGFSQEEIDKGIIFEAGPGCKKCTDGYKGRVNICEALYFTPEIRKAVLESGSEIDEDKIRKIAESQGMLSTLQSGLDRIRHGLTSITEVTYATSED